MEKSWVISNLTKEKVYFYAFSVLLEDMKSTIRDIAVVSDEELAICNKITFIRFFIIAYSLPVSDEGIHKLNLSGTIWGYNPNTKLSSLLVSGDFFGLDTLHPHTSFPILVTTSKKEDCTFLELRGNLICGASCLFI